MSNPFDDVRVAVQDARAKLRAADSVAYSMAELLRGRLRQVDSKYLLRALKSELRQYNANTGKWDEKP